MELLNCRGLTLGYEEDVLFSDLNFSVQTGDCLCVLGENGAGKSTLVRTLLGLQKPMRGTVTLSRGLRRTGIGYLPQQTDAQKDFPSSVREVVQSGFLNRMGLRPFYTAAEKREALRWMEQLEILPLRRRSFRTLSGGQQQRVLLARALCATQSLLLLDEPVTGLDPKASEAFYGLLRRLCREDGVAVLMVTHDLRALQDADRVLYIGKHETFFGSVEDYRAQEQRLWKEARGQ